ncbi:MAG: hypothetical protein WAV85_17700, partial [Rhodoferax sp.]
SETLRVAFAKSAPAGTAASPPEKREKFAKNGNYQRAKRPLNNDRGFKYEVQQQQKVGPGVHRMLSR